MINTLHETLQAKKKNLRYFAELKLEAYKLAEMLTSGVRMMKIKDTRSDFAQKGETLSVRYVGYLANGRIFDSGIFSFVLGRGEVITAWDIAFKALREGEEATIFCPSPSAYGKRGAGKSIKPYTTLIFDVTLEKIKK